MNKIKAIIVDDNEAAAKSLEIMINDTCPTIDIIAYCSDIHSAYEAIILNDPDIIFLDIDLENNTTGFHLLEKFKEIKFKIIFVTAHNQFAIKAIKYSALDYILKPVNKDELKLAIDNALKTIFNEYNYQLLMQQFHEQKIANKIMLNLGNEFQVVDIKDIVHCESEGNFSVIFTLLNKYFVSQSIGEIEELLPKDLFFRTHRSHIVNIKSVDNITKSKDPEVRLKNEKTIPLSRLKKQDFLAFFEKYAS